MAASHDDIKKIMTIVNKRLGPFFLSSEIHDMMKEMYDAVKDSKNKSVVTTFKRLVEATKPIRSN